MQKSIGVSLCILAALACFTFPSITCAAAIFNIVPQSTNSVTISNTGSALVNYTVTNNTNSSSINAITVEPGYSNSNSKFTFGLLNNTCTGINLAPGASCSFSISVFGTGQADNVTLMPRVCGYSGAACSVPIASNRVAISSVNKNLLAYIPNANNNTVSICHVNADTSLSGCTTSTGNGTFNIPLGLILNSSNSIAYIPNYGSSTVSICPITSTGSLGTCTTTTGNGTLNGPDGISLNPANTIAYIVNFNNNTLSICPLNSDGSFGTCALAAGITISTPDSIYVNSSGTMAYIGNDNLTVSLCPIKSDGTFGTCSLSTGNGTFNKVQGINPNSAGTHMYLANFGNNTVSICPLNADGTFGTCTTSTGNGTFNFSQNDAAALFMSNPNQHGYIPNDGTNTVSICPINSNGSLGVCTTTNGNATFDQPAAVFLTLIG